MKKLILSIFAATLAAGISAKPIQDETSTEGPASFGTIGPSKEPV